MKNDEFVSYIEDIYSILTKLLVSSSNEQYKMLQGLDFECSVLLEICRAKFGG